jgi:superfamily II DNA or RNA helicase
MDEAKAKPDHFSGGCLDRSHKTLKDHQKKVVKHLDDHHGLIVYHKVGSGKTLTAITVSQCYLDKYPNHHVIVITPAGLINNFKDEMTRSYMNINHPEKYSFYSFQSFMKRSKKTRGGISCANSLLIVDEAHNIRKMHTINKGKEMGVMNKFITRCAKSAHKVLLLTGTPLYNSPNDIVGLYNMINDHKEIIKPGEFKLDMMKCMVSYRGASQQFFPKRVDIDEFIPMNPSYEKKYDECILNVELAHKDPFFVDLYGEHDYKAFYNVIRRAVNNLEDKQSAKVQWIVNKLKSTPKKDKTVVFSHFKNAGIYIVMNSLPSSISYANIDGDVPAKVRKEIVERFNRDEIQVLFISKAGGEGLDLKGVRNIIIMEPAWNQATEEQVIGRGIRYMSHEHLPKSDQVVNVHHLYHIRQTDKEALDELKKWFKKLEKGEKDNEAPVDPYSQSFDIYMKYLLGKKQFYINNYEKRLQQLSIEKNECK